jgi:SIR2-like domain
VTAILSDPQVVQLARDLDHGRCAIFVGAGASVGAGLPTWPELINLLKKESGLGGNYTPQRMADYAKQVLGPRVFNELLRDVFSKVKDPCNIHDQLAKLHVPIAITTNYDCLLEACMYEQNKTRPIVLTQADTTQWLYLPDTPVATPYVLKIHGCIERTSTVVITEEDYLSFADRNPHVVRGLSEILARRPLLFVGYSLADWNIASVLWQLGTLMGDDIPNRYFIGVNLDQVAIRFLQERYHLRVINLPMGKGSIEADRRTDAVASFLAGLRELFQVPDWILEAGKGIWTLAQAQILPSTPLSSILPDIDVTARVRLALRIERHTGKEISLSEMLNPMLTVGDLASLTRERN